MRGWTRSILGISLDPYTVGASVPSLFQGIGQKKMFEVDSPAQTHPIIYDLGFQPVCCMGNQGLFLYLVALYGPWSNSVWPTVMVPLTDNHRVLQGRFVRGFTSARKRISKNARGLAGSESARNIVHGLDEKLAAMFSFPQKFGGCNLRMPVFLLNEGCLHIRELPEVVSLFGVSRNTQNNTTRGLFVFFFFWGGGFQ